MQILVAHSSRSGSTADLADWVGEALRAAGHTVTIARVGDDPDPARFDAVFVGSGIRAAAWHSDGADWVKRHAAALRGRPVVTFTGSLQAADPSAASQEQTAGYTTKLVEPLGITPVAHGNLVGAYDPDKVSLPERMIMKAIKQGARRDDRDPDAVRAWALGALAALPGS